MALRNVLILRKPPFETPFAAAPQDKAAVSKDALRRSSASSIFFTRSIAALPDYRHIVIGKHLVDRNHVTVLGQRLSHHDPIPGIAVRPGKCCGGKRVVERDRHRVDAVSLQAAR